ncbi:MAG TPA: LysM domain-containing protein [Longimicrobium sp.]|nr:LysM domain-containing protein [Longimicrobium sp.]
MTDPLKALEALLGGAAAGTPAFPPNSRYHGVATGVHLRPDGRTVAYLLRRRVPPPEAFADVGAHVVVQGERLDHLAERYYGDPELFWRLADANGALRPDELETPGRRLRITLPEGIPGTGGSGG